MNENKDEQSPSAPAASGFDPSRWRDEESAAFAEMMELPGWHYCDMPNMAVEFMDQFKDLVGDENLRWITFAERRWPDEAITQRGQVMISPEGMERIAAFNRDRDRSSEAGETQSGSTVGRSPDPKGIAQGSQP